MKAETENIINAEDLTKIYHRGSEEIMAINHISLTIKKGDHLAFIGPSGSGKTTLINILGCLDNPTQGRLKVNEEMIFDQGKALSELKLTKIRRRIFGYVFQRFYLIPTLTVEENILLPWAFYKKSDQQEDVNRIMQILHLEHRRHHLPGQLSGGEMQRVAIARALINKPQILLADEPTGNLDTANMTEIGKLLGDLNQIEGITVILVTHNLELAKKAGQIIEIRDGRIQ